MMQLSQENREKVLESLKTGKIDSATINFPNLIDTIILAVKKMGLIERLSNSFNDKRKDNKKIPFGILIALAVTAKMKLKTSLTDVSHAITDAETLAAFGWNLWDTEREINNGLFSEGVMRNIVEKYEASEFIDSYNAYVKDEVLETPETKPSIHILDCTNIAVNLSNDNFEKSEVIKIDGVTTRGYKLGTLRGVFGDGGIMEEITLGGLKTHDMELCRDMLKNTHHFKTGDILINDRGFISRDILNHLKTKRGVDTYVPAKKNMVLYEDAVSIAKSSEKWQAHPNKKRKTQKIQLVKDLGSMWESETPEEDVALCACVVWDIKDDEYYVFMTTDTTKTARQIISTYELRAEIEEDYRQIKDFWRLEDFKSTQYNYIAFHIVMTLIGYLYYQIFKNTEEGSAFSGKSLPVVIKNFVFEKPKSVIVYVGQYFGIFPFLEFIRIYASLDGKTRTSLDHILALV
jgi:hypothetical protein